MHAMRMIRAAYSGRRMHWRAMAPIDRRIKTGLRPVPSREAFDFGSITPLTRSIHNNERYGLRFHGHPIR